MGRPMTRLGRKRPLRCHSEKALRKPPKSGGASSAESIGNADLLNSPCRGGAIQAYTPSGVRVLCSPLNLQSSFGALSPMELRAMYGMWRKLPLYSAFTGRPVEGEGGTCHYSN
jgi:hypothetical protein